MEKPTRPGPPRSPEVLYYPVLGNTLLYYPHAHITLYITLYRVIHITLHITLKYHIKYHTQYEEIFLKRTCKFRDFESVAWAFEGKRAPTR